MVCLAAHRTEEQDHPPLGKAWDEALGAERPAHRLDLHLRRDLPEGRQGGRPDPAEVQHRGNAAASRRNRQGRRAEAPGHPASRSGGMAYVPQARRPGQSHPPAPASQCPEFNPVETIWQFLRDNWLSNRGGRRVRLSGTPWLGSEFVQASQQWSSIMSIVLRQWANRS
jgi:hypothetical protein